MSSRVERRCRPRSQRQQIRPVQTTRRSIRLERLQQASPLLRPPTPSLHTRVPSIPTSSGSSPVPLTETHALPCPRLIWPSQRRGTRRVKSAEMSSSGASAKRTCNTTAAEMYVFAESSAVVSRLSDAQSCSTTMTLFRRCTKRSAAATRTRRCTGSRGCWRAAMIRCSSPVDSFEWYARSGGVTLFPG